MGPGSDERVVPAAARGGDAAQHGVVVAGVRVHATEHVHVEAESQLREDPPRGAPVRSRDDDGRRVLRAVGVRHVLEHRDVGTLELAGDGEDVRGRLGQLRANDVEHDERVEASERRSRAGGIGERGQWVPARDQQDAQRTAFDLVGERNARVLAEPAPELGA